MIKKLAFLLLAVTIAATVFSQVKKAADIVITPGVGIGPLKLGMSESEAYKILKGDITWTDYKEKMQVFRGSEGNYSIDSVTQFVLGFDSCGTYNNNLPKSLPIFTLYFSNHQLNYIMITSYGAPKALVKRVVLKNGLRFYSSMASCKAKMKTKYLAIKLDSYDGDHIYYNEGLEFTYDNKKLTAIGLFTPRADFLQLIKERSADLQREFNNPE